MWSTKAGYFPPSFFLSFSQWSVLVLNASRLPLLSSSLPSPINQAPNSSNNQSSNQSKDRWIWNPHICFHIGVHFKLLFCHSRCFSPPKSLEACVFQRKSKQSVFGTEVHFKILFCDLAVFLAPKDASKLLVIWGNSNILLPMLRPTLKSFSAMSRCYTHPKMFETYYYPGELSHAALHTEDHSKVVFCDFELFLAPRDTWNVLINSLGKSTHLAFHAGIHCRTLFCDLALFLAPTWNLLFL